MSNESEFENETQVLSPDVVKQSEGERMLAFMEAISNNIKLNAESLKVLAKASKMKHSSRKRRHGSDSSSSSGSDSRTRQTLAKQMKLSARSSARFRHLIKKTCLDAEGQRLSEHLRGLNEGS